MPHHLPLCFNVSLKATKPQRCQAYVGSHVCTHYPREVRGREGTKNGQKDHLADKSKIWLDPAPPSGNRTPFLAIFLLLYGSALFLPLSLPLPLPLSLAQSVGAPVSSSLGRSLPLSLSLCCYLPLADCVPLHLGLYF